MLLNKEHREIPLGIADSKWEEVVGCLEKQVKRIQGIGKEYLIINGKMPKSGRI